jgi:hypothetical protein
MMAATACSAARFEVRGAPARPFDVVIVPGCPSEDDGSLSRCQKGRALWAARLWELGWAEHFITSGAAVYTPYVEAEAIAAAMSALGVPAERIYLEPNALHTDENLYYSLRIARALRFSRVAVASNGATFDCLMLEDWGQPASAFTMDIDWVKARGAQVGARLDGVRARRAGDFVPLAVRERERARASGRHRPPSFLLYPGLGLMRTNGERWIPAGAPLDPPRRTWARALDGG